MRIVKDNEENETLGTCGCVDYHVADCPLRASYFDMGLIGESEDFLEGY